MLSLLSGQLMPKVIAAAQYQPDRIEAFATDQSKRDFPSFQAAIQLLKKRIALNDQPRIVDAYDIGFGRRR
jgi:hypothetical protein